MSVVVVVVRSSGGGGGEGGTPPPTTTTYLAAADAPTDGIRYKLSSVTMVLASLPLARAVGAGVVALDTPVAALLPDLTAPLPPPQRPRLPL